MTNAEAIKTASLNMLAIIIDCPVEAFQNTSEQLVHDYWDGTCQEKHGDCINCRREWLSQETVISKEASA